MPRHQADPRKEQLWRQRFREQQESGLSRTEFCRRNQLSTHTFDFWRRLIAQRDAQKLSASTSTTQAKSPRLVPVQLLANSPLTIQLRDGTSILVPPGFDPRHLQAVLALLQTGEGASC